MSKRCLLVECCPYHWEVLPDWVQLLQTLGHRVDVATDDTPGHQETRTLLDDDTVGWFDVEKLLELPLDDYDFVLLGTLIHEEYGLDLGAVPMPGMDLVERLGLPSLCVIHEPLSWTRKAPTASFDVFYPGGQTFLALYADGSFYLPGDPWVEAPWRDEAGTLRVPMADRHRTFVSEDGGQRYTSREDAVTLVRRPAPRIDLAGFTASGRHRVLALSHAGRDLLAPSCPSAEWLMPLTIRPRPAVVDASPRPLVFAGQVDYDRKAIPSLIDVARDEGERILILGGSRDEDFEGHAGIQRLRRDIARHGLEDVFEFTGYLDYGEFRDQVARSRFIAPLIDPWVDGGAYLSKLPALVPLSLGFGVPLLLEESMARHFGLDFMITYPGTDLASGVRKIHQLDPQQEEALRRRTLEEAERLHKHNLAVLARSIETILSAG